MSEINTIIEVSQIVLDDDIFLTLSSSAVNKLAQVVDKSIEEILANDLKGATIIGERMFYHCSALTNVVLPNGISNINDYAFDSCGSLTTVDLGNNNLTLGTYCFRGCSSLSSINLANVSSIGTYAFQDCTALTSVDLSGITKTIPSRAFSGCSELIDVIIGAKVTAINSYAFQNCTKLETITILKTTPPTLSNTNAIPTTISVIYIPIGTLEAYSTATNWSSFASKFVEKEM